MSKNGFTSPVQHKYLDDLQRDYVDLYLSYCGIEDVYPGFAFGPKIRTEYVLHIVLNGTGTFTTNGKSYSLTQNQAFLIYPDVETFYQADADNPWSYMWVGFDGLRANECAANAGFSPESPVRTLVTVDKLKDYITQMLNSQELTYANDLERTGLLMMFWSVLINDYISSIPTRKNYDYPGSVYVKSAINYMSHNFASKIKISELADHLGINRSHLTSSFKKVLRISPQEFLINLRMEKAASLLKKTSLPVSEIAEQVGYDDPLSFSRSFKKKFDLSPRAYRKCPEPEELITAERKGD
ncbi:MAG: AraC family transcriptional regulator [Lachnospiraceae bacterium]